MHKWLPQFIKLDSNHVVTKLLVPTYLNVEMLHTQTSYKTEATIPKKENKI